MVTNSRTLLSQYARTGSETAFRELVSRYIDFVYSTAHRLVDGDAEAAKDVAQTVFVDLANQARTLPEDVMLGGWLHLHTRFAAGKLMRTERRRRSRERQAAQMNALEDHSPGNLAQIAPVLDEAIGQLDAEDRDAILLRFFERQDFRTVGETLRTSEEAARKRVARALEKLRLAFSRRGITLSATTLGATLAAEAVTAAPAGLASAIAASALSVASGGTATGLKVLLSRLLGLSRAQTSVLCLAIVAGPVIWEWNAKRVCLARAALAQSQLSAVREEASRSADELAKLRADSASLDISLAEAENESAPYAKASQKLETLKGRVRALLAGGGSPWPTNLPYVRVPKAAIRSLDPQHRPMGRISDLALELYGITAQEKAPAELALARYFQGVGTLMVATANEITVSNTQPTRFTKTVTVAPPGQLLQALGNQAGLQLTNILGGEREKLLFDGGGKGAAQQITCCVEPPGTNGGPPRCEWTRTTTGQTFLDGSFSRVLSPILERFFYPWLEQLGATNRYPSWSTASAR